jgi:hypothetical protein
MATHHITDEELDSLLSDYMTKESIELIVNKVRSGVRDTVVHEDVEVKLKLLRRLWRWSEIGFEEPDSPGYDLWKSGEIGFKGFENKIVKMQKELIPRLDVDKFNMVSSRTVEECLMRD